MVSKLRLIVRLKVQLFKLMAVGFLKVEHLDIRLRATESRRVSGSKKVRRGQEQEYRKITSRETRRTMKRIVLFSGSRSVKAAVTTDGRTRDKLACSCI